MTTTRRTDRTKMSGLIRVTASDGVGQPHTGVVQRSHTITSPPSRHDGFLPAPKEPSSGRWPP
jgi:hypothetical protein